MKFKKGYTPWIKGKKHSEETKRKMSIANKRINKGKKFSEETKRKMREAHKGKHFLIKRNCLICNKLFRTKMSHIKKGSGKYCSKKCYGISRQGKKLSKERRIKMSNAHKGKKFSIEHKRKLSLLRKGKPSPMKGERHHKWKGGITPLHTRIRKSLKYKQWRQSVYMRDDFTCQCCDQRGGWIEAHHIKFFKELVQEALKYMPLLPVYEAAMLYSPLWDKDNGITLCSKCHKH